MWVNKGLSPLKSLKGPNMCFYNPRSGKRVYDDPKRYTSNFYLEVKHIASVHFSFASTSFMAMNNFKGENYNPLTCPESRELKVFSEYNS